MKKTRYALLTAATLAAIIIAPAQSIYAINDGAGQALEIAPPVLTLSANPGQTINAQIDLRDISNSPLVVTGTVNDFSAKDENGNPNINLDTAEPSPYSIRPWLQPLAQLNMKSKELQKLPIVIKVPANASPGGYWGVIRFTATPPNMDQTGVSLSASLGSLIFVRVNGDAKENMSVAGFYTTEPGRDTAASLFESTPINFVLRIQNNGNVQEQPYGQIIVTDMFGRAAAAVNMNLERRNVLPGSIRKFTAPLDKGALGTSTLFGKYTAKITMNYGPKSQTTSATLTFWIIPYRLIIIIIVGLILLFFIIRALIRNYNRRITRRVRTSRR